jgi:amidophosphoribosyltransferase
LGEPGRNTEAPQYTDHYFTGDYPTPITDLVSEGGKQLSLLAEAS